MAVETCEIHWRKKGRGKWVFYAKAIGPDGINESEEWPEFLEIESWISGGGHPGEPNYVWESDTNRRILDRFINHLVQNGWEYISSDFRGSDLAARLTRTYDPNRGIREWVDRIARAKDAADAPAAAPAAAPPAMSQHEGGGATAFLIISLIIVGLGVLVYILSQVGAF